MAVACLPGSNTGSTGSADVPVLCSSSHAQTTHPTSPHSQTAAGGGGPDGGDMRTRSVVAAVQHSRFEQRAAALVAFVAAGAGFDVAHAAVVVRILRIHRGSLLRRPRSTAHTHLLLLHHPTTHGGDGGSDGVSGDSRNVGPSPRRCRGIHRISPQLPQQQSRCDRPTHCAPVRIARVWRTLTRGR